MVQKVILSANPFEINVKTVQKLVPILRIIQGMTKKPTKDKDIKDSKIMEDIDDEFDLESYDDGSYELDYDYTTQY